MKHFVIAIAAFSLTALAGSSSYSGAYTGSDEFYGELRACDGTPWIVLEGVEHYVIHIRENNANFFFTLNLQGNYTGYDLDGNEYILNYQWNTNAKFSKGEQGVIHETMFENLVSKGSGENLKLRYVFKVVFNANGEPTVYTEIEEDYCDE